MKQSFLVVVMIMLATLLSACGDNSNSGSSTNSPLNAIHGAGVKGPLAGAVVQLYTIDYSQTDLKGALLDEGITGSDAAITGLSIPPGLFGLVVLEFVADADTTDIGTGMTPVIDRLTTVVDVQRIYNGDAIYATPLTSMAVSLAQANADKGAPYAGDSDLTTSKAEFTAALAVAQNQVKSTLGFGLDSSVDIFSDPPILTADTTTEEAQTKVVKYRQAIESIAALVDHVASDSSASDTPQEIFDGLIEDLKDGTIDGLNDATPVTTLAALDTPIDTTLGSLDPTTLVIPNTSIAITDIKQTLEDELVTTGEVVDTTPLAQIEVNPAPPVLVAESNNSYTVGGTVSGLSGSVVLQNNAGSDLTLSANGGFTFVTPVADGNAYNVTVGTQPSGQTCTASANSGTVSGANITNVIVTCATNTYSISGNVTGLSGSVVLQNNGGDDLTRNADGEFTFNTAVAEGSSYNVSVLSQPVGQTCVASSNTGSVSGADVINVAITCTTNTYTIGGSVTGLTGSVVLQNNGGDDLTLNADTNFTFLTAVAYGSAYNVSVLTQPAGQTCTASSNTGTVGAANVNDVLLYCSTNPVLNARPGPASVTLSWDDTGASSYDLYYASAPGCDIANYASCADGTMVPNVSSPYTVSSLTNGQNYWFQLEAVVDSVVAAKRVAARGMAARGMSQAASNEVGTRPDIIVPDGAVMAVSHDATSGVTYLGGLFSRIGLNTGYGVPLNPDTGYPAAFPPVSNSGGAGLVTAAAADGTGGYYIGGLFDTVGGETCGNLAHILADGTLDAAWTPSTNVFVTALAVSGDTVYVGGYFTAITDGFGTQTRNRLAAIDSSGNVTSWDPNANNTVNTIAVSGSMVYVGGRFTSFGGGATARNRIAAFDTSSLTPEVPTDWDPSASATVNALAVSGDMVYVGGAFSSFGGGTTARNNLAAIDSSGNVTDWDPNASNTVTTLAVSGDMVYAGGYFTSFGSGAEYPRIRLAAFDTGSLTPSIPTDWAPSADTAVSAIAVSGSTVYVGGTFTTIDDGSGAQDRPYLAAIGGDGTLSSWNPAPSDNVAALAVSGSTVYVGGSFGSVNSESRSYLAAVNDDGTLNSWAPVADNAVNDLVVSGSTVYVGGYFGSIDDGSGAQARNSLAAIGTDGTLDTTWAPTIDKWVNAIALSDSTVFVGGAFTQVGGVAHGYLAALDSNGNLTNWSPSASSTVDDLAVSGNTVYVGGYFTSITDTASTSSTGKSLAAFNATTGVVDPNWNPVASYGSGSGLVHTLAVSGSTVYVGGQITSITDGVNTLNDTNLAAIGTDGTLDVTTWIPSVDSVVYGIAVSGSTVYVGGGFANIDDNHGTARAQNSIAAIGTDGYLNSWDPAANYKVRDFAVSDTSLYAGGYLIGGGGTQGYFSALDLAP